MILFDSCSLPCQQLWAGSLKKWSTSRSSSTSPAWAAESKALNLLTSPPEDCRFPNLWGTRDLQWLQAYAPILRNCRRWRITQGLCIWGITQIARNSAICEQIVTRRAQKFFWLPTTPSVRLSTITLSSQNRWPPVTFPYRRDPIAWILACFAMSLCQLLNDYLYSICFWKSWFDLLDLVVSTPHSASPYPHVQSTGRATSERWPLPHWKILLLDSTLRLYQLFQSTLHAAQGTLSWGLSCRYILWEGEEGNMVCKKSP